MGDSIQGDGELMGRLIRHIVLVRILDRSVRRIGQAFVRVKDFLPERNSMVYSGRKKILEASKGLARAQQAAH